MGMHIGYHNLFTDSGATVTVSSAATGFEGVNAYSGFGYDWWKPTTTTGYNNLEVEFASAKTADYVAIWGHTIGSIGAGALIAVSHSEDGITWSDSVSATSVTDNNTIYIPFTSSSHKYWRVSIYIPSTTLPFIAGIQIGDRLEMPNSAEVGFAVPTLAPKTKLKTARSESGAFIGGSQLSQGIDGSISFTNIDPAWVRSDWEPFIAHVQTPAVFVMAWDTVTYTDEIMLAWADGDVSVPNYSSPLYMNFSLKFEGTK